MSNAAVPLPPDTELVLTLKIRGRIETERQSISERSVKDLGVETGAQIIREMWTKLRERIPELNQ